MRFLLSIVLLALLAVPALAEPCATPVGELTAFADEHGLPNKTLTATEAIAAATSVMDPVPEGIESGLIVLRADQAIVLVLWLKDGSCGHGIVPPLMTEKMLRAISGFGA